MKVRLTNSALIRRYGTTIVNFDRSIALRFISNNFAIPIEPTPKKETKIIEIMEKPIKMKEEVIFPENIIPAKKEGK